MTKRLRGRPKLDPEGDSVMVSVRLTAKQYDETYARAAARRVTVSDVIRHALGPPRLPVLRK
jgi:hypothetical protein